MTIGGTADHSHKKRTGEHAVLQTCDFVLLERVRLHDELVVGVMLCICHIACLLLVIPSIEPQDIYILYIYIVTLLQTKSYKH